MLDRAEDVPKALDSRGPPARAGIEPNAELARNKSENAFLPKTEASNLLRIKRLETGLDLRSRQRALAWPGSGHGIANGWPAAFQEIQKTNHSRLPLIFGALFKKEG